MDIRSGLDAKLIPAEEAVCAIKPGDRVFIGTACATRRTLVRAQETCPNQRADVQLIHVLTTGVIAPEQGVPHSIGVVTRQGRHGGAKPEHALYTRGHLCVSFPVLRRVKVDIPPAEDVHEVTMLF